MFETAINEFVKINKTKIDSLKNETLFNATPVNVMSTDNNIIDGRPFTNTGKQISLEQAKIQFKIYTGIDYE